MARLATGLALLLLAAIGTTVHAADAARRPNIILIMADDFGYECVGANGGTSYKTPHLDRLAAYGMRFTHCYAQPLCTPTRVQLMTGMYNVRNYTDFGVMDPESTTFAHLLKRSGYATGIAGKWQLGRVAGLPEKLGFDEHCLWQHTRRPSRYKNPGLEINGKEVDHANGEYGPDIVNDWAIDFIERHKDRPFFLYYPQMLTHSPFEPTPDSRDYHGKPARPNADVEPDARPKAKIDQANFGAMVTYMDKLIGKLVTRLEELQLHENTLILFLGDNGTGAGIRSKMGDRVVVGGKGKLTDAGMHVPLIAYWHGTIARPKVCDDLVDTTDFLPTICQAAGCETPRNVSLDGRSFLPQLLGEKGDPREWYYCWYAPRRKFVGEFAANHRFKLYRNGRLFDLKADVEEQNPLDMSALPGEAAEATKTLQAALDQYKDARPERLNQ